MPWKQHVSVCACRGDGVMVNHLTSLLSGHGGSKRPGDSSSTFRVEILIVVIAVSTDLWDICCRCGSPSVCA